MYLRGLPAACRFFPCSTSHSGAAIALESGAVLRFVPKEWNVMDLSFARARAATRARVRLLDGYGRLKAMYATIQAAISAAIAGDEVVIAPGVYAEDLYVNARLTLTCAAERSGPERTGKAIVVGHVVVAATAVELVVDGVAIDGGLTMQSAGGATASITLRSSGIQGSGVSCARLSWLPHVRD